MTLILINVNNYALQYANNNIGITFDGQILM